MAAVRDASGRFIKGSGAPGWTPSGAAAGPIVIKLDTRALNAFRKRVERYQGKPLRYRMDRGVLEAAKLLAPSVRAAAPKGPTGNLKRRVRAARISNGGPSLKKLAAGRGGGAFFGATEGGLSGAVVGSTAPHRHLVIRGHRIVTPGGRDTGRMSTANPFVDSAVKPRAAEAMRVVSRAIFGGG